MHLLRTAEIVAIGSELVTPHRIDTNSLFLTSRLNELGITVRVKSAVADERDDLIDVLRQALARADLVITTGGLGPTGDDLTREVVASLLELSLQEDSAVLAAIEARFSKRNVRMPAINRRQAQVPRGATVLPNPHGTAPGLLLTPGDRLLVLLPGPPREMRPMFEDHVAPALAARTEGSRVRRRVVKVTGRSESQVEELASPIYSNLSHGAIPIQTTILAAPGQIELHLAASGRDIAAIDAALEAGVQSLQAALGSVVFSVDGRSLEQVIGSLLQDLGWHIAVAESCTGGSLMARLTDVPGSSAWVLGGVVAYDNAVKIDQLGIDAALIERHGAVSEPVGRAMAESVRTRLRADIGVGITGIAGPGGGSAEKPVGTVVLAVATPTETIARTVFFPGDREFVRRHSTAGALDLARRALDPTLA